MIESTPHKFSLRTRDGVDVAYWVRRATAPRGTLLLLHGAASNHTRWEAFLQTTSLTQTWNALCPDLRGHAASLTRGDMSLTRHCEDLVQMLEAHPAADIIVVGHSLGANLALHFAARHPDRIHALVLIDPVVRDVALRPLTRGLARGVLHVLLWATRALNRLGVKRHRFPELNLTELDAIARKLLDAGRETEMKRLYSSTFEDLKYLPVSAYLQDVLNVIQPLPSRLPDVPALMLLSTGQDTPELANNRALARRLTRCTVVEIPCNHWILTVAPEPARMAIEKFVAAH